MQKITEVESFAALERERERESYPLINKIKKVIYEARQKL